MRNGNRMAHAVSLAGAALLFAVTGCNHARQASHEQETATAAPEIAQAHSAPVEAQAPEHHATAEPAASHTGYEASPAPVKTAAKPVSRPKPQATEPVRQAQAPAKKKVETTTLDAGTVLTLALDTVLSSNLAQPGDSFTAKVVTPIVVGDVIAIPEGAIVHGHVSEAVAAKRGAGNARLSLSFDELELADGHRMKMTGSFHQETGSQKKKNAAIIGGAAAGGALLGRVLGKDTKGAVVGSVVGGGIGTAVVLGRDDGQVDLPAGTPFEVALDEALNVPRQR